MNGRCEVCDRGGRLTTYLGDVRAHTACAPSHWEKDRTKLADFLAEVRRRREAA